VPEKVPNRGKFWSIFQTISIKIGPPGRFLKYETPHRVYCPGDGSVNIHRPTTDTDDMSTIGQKLGRKRLEKGLTVNDVAHETRIHPNMILNIEEDDYSKFPSVAYAKSFLRKYSEYLEIDLSTSMDHLNSGTTLRLGDNELMGEMKKTIKKDSLFRLERRPKGFRRRPEKVGGAPLFLNFILLALIFALGIFYFLGYNASSIEEAKSDIATGLNKAIPFSGPVVENPATLPTVTAPAAPVATVPTPAATPAPAAPATPTVATTSPSPVEPRPTPQYPIIKPAVSLPRDENLPAIPPAEIPQNPLRPRDTPRMVFADEPVQPPGAGEMPTSKKPAVEPQAVLRPDGTDPTASGTVNPPPASPPAGNSTARPAPGTAPAPAPAPTEAPVRAVPVAASE
jgi:cytoskeletal protein RodZ